MAEIVAEIMADGGEVSDAREKPRYRLLVLAQDGVVLRTETLVAGSDEEATELAHRLSAESAVELWDGLRFIEQFPLVAGLR